ncbi:MAG TPA: lytic transglycosylase domain-containing protein [Myxococcota bacterium]|nr:lytic transglycosylase domain-containing protein [Myxococcota bacterium]
MDRTRRSLVPLLTLAMAAVLSCDVRVASAPAPIPASVAAVAPAPDAEVEAVLDHLARYAARTSLTEREMRSLSRTIVAEARRHRLDPRLVLAVVHVESRYDTYAVSDKQAMGLMQMLPSTGEWLAAQVGVVWKGPQTLFDPISNVRLGVAYLRMLLDRYDGNLSAALVAYNWGPAHVDGRLRDGVPLPADYADLVLRAYGRHT